MGVIARPDSQVWELFVKPVERRFAPGEDKPPTPEEKDRKKPQNKGRE